MVRAAGEFGVAHMLSSVCEPGLEKVAEAAPDATRIFQLYVRGDEAWVDDYRRARHRQRLCRRSASPSTPRSTAGASATSPSATSSPGRRRATRPRVPGGARLAHRQAHQAASSTFRSMLKGIATAEDARIALDHGVDWIYVSNHGGRQLDHGRGSMDVLPEIVEAVDGRAKIIVDGGFARGTDIVKAIAAGADLVGLGRMQCYALAAGGEARARAHARAPGGRGAALPRPARRDAASPTSTARICMPAPSPTAPHVFSAFPLLKIDDYRY